MAARRLRGDGRNKRGETRVGKKMRRTATEQRADDCGVPKFRVFPRMREKVLRERGRVGMCVLAKKI